MKSTEAVTVMVYIRAGSRFENEKNNGIAHFLEHMFFKGTEKRPTTLDISREIEGVGGDFNAWTSEEYTGYYFKVTRAHADLALDLVSDMLLNSKFDADEIEREKGVILQEINMYLDDPRSQIHNIWEEVLYPGDQAGRPVIGTPETVSSFNRDTFVNFIQERYQAESTVVAIAGNFDEKGIDAKIKEKFKTISTGSVGEQPPVTVSQDSPNVLLQHKETDQAHFALGVRGYDLFHEDRHALQLLSIVLGGGMSSRLFIEIRERQGLAYYVGTRSDNSTDTGNLATFAGVQTDKIDAAITTTLQEYTKLMHELVDADELTKAKELIKGKTQLGLESSNERAAWGGVQELLRNEIVSLDDALTKIDAVTPEDIQRVAQDIFKANALNLAVIGPFKDKQKFGILLQDSFK